MFSCVKLASLGFESFEYWVKGEFFKKTNTTINKFVFSVVCFFRQNPFNNHAKNAFSRP